MVTEKNALILQAFDNKDIRDLIFQAEKYLWRNPETGYREWKQSSYLEAAYEKLGYKLNRAGNIPGFYADIDTGLPGPKILIMSELDSLLCNDHPDADPATGAVHACGHNAQSAALLGVAAVLKNSALLDGLCGSIRLCVVPAEELIEIGYREELKKQGIIKYFGGKVEFLHRGYFDGVDIGFMIHTGGGDHNSFSLEKGNNGCVVKKILYKGVAAHAGGAPHAGVNALYAANIGLSAINALRETFRDSDHIRVHPIITAGGTAVNAIPSEVKIESYVRGADIEAIAAVNKKVSRAIAAGALALGASVEISDRPGYAPLINDVNLNALAEKAMNTVVHDNIEGKSEFTKGKVTYNTEGWGTGCTDMGDLSAVMPAIHPHCSGSSGMGHGNDYKIANVESACVNSAKAQLVMLNMLLADDAKEANHIVANKKLRYNTYADYFKAIDQFMTDTDALTYGSDGKIKINL
jgi:amidohydrolase